MLRSVLEAAVEAHGIHAVLKELASIQRTESETGRKLSARWFAYDTAIIIDHAAERVAVELETFFGSVKAS